MASFDKISMRGHGKSPAASRLVHGTPEDVFLAWVLWLPVDSDVAECARVEMARIDACSTASADRLQLRELFRHAAGMAH